MMRRDLLDLLNSGTAWAFVGSGVSCDAGHPGWRDLVDNVVGRQLPNDLADEITQDTRFQVAKKNQDYPRALQRIESMSDRDALESAVRAEIRTDVRPGHLAKLLADFPFQGYVTTNYDSILEDALAHTTTGWVPVGNTSEELRKVSGGADRVVWHAHGLVTNDVASHMVLTTADYENLYLEGSALMTQLRGLISQRRMVFAGFGFEDPYLMRLLRLVGRFTNPARPAYALLPASVLDEPIAIELLERYNVDVIPYPSDGMDHSQLRSTLELYGALTVRRSISFSGMPRTGVPEHDPATTGMLLYNKLCLDEGTEVSEGVVNRLVRGLTLALLGDRPSLRVSELIGILDERARLLSQDSQAPDWAPRILAEALRELEQQNLVQISGTDPDEMAVSLTPRGEHTRSEQSAYAELLRRQFVGSLEDRLEPYRGELGEQAIGRIAGLTSAFLQDCVERRALGVALALAAVRPEIREYQVTALLRELPAFLSQLRDGSEAHAMVVLVRDLFAAFEPSEAKYIGLQLQAEFGAHLVGANPDAMDARLAALANTVFLVDSTTLIPLLARSSPGHEAAQLFLNRVTAVGATVATTELLAEEVAEHARWALEKVGAGGTLDSADAILVATGRAGYRSNAFLQGAVEEMATGRGGASLRDYLASILGPQGADGRYESAHVARALTPLGMTCDSFSAWEGFRDELFYERDSVQARVAGIRRQHRTFRHPRQVQAEAEAAIIISELRAGTMLLAGEPKAQAYFITQTRAVEEASGGQPITMRLDSALQWLATLAHIRPEELAVFSNILLWELSVTGQDLLDVRRLGITFGPYAVASKERLEEELVRQDSLVAERYGERGTGDLAAVDTLDAPVVLHSMMIQLKELAEEKLRAERERSAQLADRARLSQKERERLARLDAKEHQRKLRARSRQSASGSGKRKKRRRRR